MKNKILIFFPREVNINAGGPAGFLAHNLEDKPRDFFDFSRDLAPRKNVIQTILYRISRFFNSLYKKQEFHKEYFKARDEFIKVKANEYKYLYFHEDIDYYRVKDLISDDQVVIFQPHCPEIHSEEYRAYAPNNVQMYQYIQKAEKAVFERADVVILPNPECKPIYRTLYTKRNAFYYILSGAKSTNTSVESVALPSDKINLMYIGRRNKVKGFDLVIDSFRKAREHRKDIHLFVIGKGEKIQEEGISDIGFSDNPISWYNSVDYLINANRQSYFDLSIIEAVSTGVPIIMSDNLGHQYYKNKSELITTYDSNQEMALFHILMGKLQKREPSRQDNVLLYQQELTDLHYYERFKQFFNDLPSLIKN
ncbi:glycosyltransferase [[Pasteurella] aerogenes]